MVKEKRKQRLDKGGATTEFIGFSAFATTTGDGNATSPTDDTTTSTSTTISYHPQYAPAYTGSDAALHLLFPRIANKRDATTKVKALQELASYISKGDGSKKLQAEALAHYAWLFSHKLQFDSNFQVRAASFTVWSSALERLPRAFGNCVSRCNNDHGSELAGMLYAGRVDTAAEVRNQANVLYETVVKQQQQQQQQEEETDNNSRVWTEGIWRYATRIFSYGRPSAFYQDVTVGKSTTSGNNSNSNSNSSSKKTAWSDLNETQRDAAEETFERIVGTALQAVELWMREHCGKKSLQEEDTNNACTPPSVAVAASPLVPDSIHVATSTTHWWKTLKSNKAGLRRKTYQLLATTALLQPDWILCNSSGNGGGGGGGTGGGSDESDNDYVSTTMLPQVLLSEKEASNIPALLETLLTVLVAHQKKRKISNTYYDPTATFQKPLVKLLKKACFGARTDAWGPILLPLTAAFPDALTLLQAAWDGRGMTLGSQDKWLLLSAITECASFALLRKRRPPIEDDEQMSLPPSLPNPQAVAQVWLDVWEEALSVVPPVSLPLWSPPTTTTTAATARPAPQLHLLAELSKSLVQFEQKHNQQATQTETPPTTPITQCSWNAVETWFWESGLTFGSSAHPLAVAHVLRALREQQQQHQQKLLLLPHIKTYFLQDLSRYQGASGSVLPSLESYQLYQEAFAYVGPAAIFSDEGALEKFVMNDLLRWIILHTTSMSTMAKQSRGLVRHDFQLLSCCLASPVLVDKRQSLWQAILREIIQAQCHLKWLVEGVRVLLQQQQQQHAVNNDGVEEAQENNSQSWISCPTLDQLALDVGLLRYPASTKDLTEEQQQPHEEEATEGYVESHDDDGRLDFFRLCLGLLRPQSYDPIMLVSRPVLTEWIEFACPEINPNNSLIESTDRSAPSLLETLLELVRSKRSPLEVNELDRILFKSWYRGGSLFVNDTLRVFKRDQSLCLRFVSRSSESIHQQYIAVYDLTRNDSSVASALSKSWSNRAWRLIQASKCLEKESGNNLQPSFKLLGLAETDLWEASPDLLYLCTMSLFEQVVSPSDRQALLANSEDEMTKLTVTILLSISEATTDAARAARAKSRHDRCALFLNALGGREMDRSFVVKLVHSTIAVISKDATLQRGVAVLSQLIENLFGPATAPASSGKLDASDLIEGSRVWYISDPENESLRELVDVVKVHFDSQIGYYITIQLVRDGVSQERQTVVERLRRDCLEPVLTENELTQRAEIRDLILREVINRHLSSAHWTSMVAEFVSVVCCALGLGPQRGVGSGRYDLLQRMKSVEDRCISALRCRDIPTATDALWTLALALGYGFNTPSCSWVFEEIPIDPLTSYSEILECYDGIGLDVSTDLNNAVLAWLSTSLMYTVNNNNNDIDGCEPSVDLILALLFKLGRNFFTQHEKLAGFSGSHLVVCRAIYEGFRVLSSPFAADVQSKVVAEEVAIPLVKNFACYWEDEVLVNDFGLPTPDWTLYSYFPQITSLSRSSGTVNEILTLANEPVCVEALSNSLFVVSKRQHALRLLDTFVSTGSPVFEGVALAKDTSRRLKAWTEGLEAEEAEEVEEDVELVSRWLPRRMMNEIEEWGEEVYEETDDPTTIGRLLTWIYVLQTVDVVSPKDFRYRPAFMSYLSQCGAANAALNIALLNDECINIAKGKIAPSLLSVDGLLQGEFPLELSTLSSLVLFLTVEILPALSRRWWEESCPKVYIVDVQNFVEKWVAPEILRRELDRIRTDAESTYGDMSVRASSATREVSATYVQDDFTLSVLIQLPPAFPLRGAKVDCSKTLGVPPARWKRWSLQITQMLNNQGGTLQDALVLWKDNVDKEFEGVEPCPVCYSVLHVKTHKLPALECKTCNNRFHFDCLTQWFRSSGKSQCVLCQQPWQGTRI